jgi:hypothetical protein
MAASIDLVTAAEVKTYLGITGSTHDTLIDELIDIVSEFIEDYCGTFFTTTSVTEKVDGGCEYLIMERAPISSIVSITDNEDSTTVTSSGYDFYSDAALVYKELDVLLWPNITENWGVGKQRYTVVYVAGHSAVPETIKWVAYKLIERNLKALPDSNNKGRWTQPDIVNVEKPMLYGMLTAEERALLAKYRHRVIG